MSREELQKMNRRKKRFSIRTSKLLERFRQVLYPATGRKNIILKKLQNLTVKKTRGIATVSEILAHKYPSFGAEFRILQKTILTLQLQHTSPYVQAVEYVL